MVSRQPGVSQGVPQYTGHPMTCTLAAILHFDQPVYGKAICTESYIWGHFLGSFSQICLTYKRVKNFQNFQR